MSVFSKPYENILTSRPEPGVALVTLNRPKALNALNTALFTELNDALQLIDADREIGAIVITGSERAFAGASNPSCLASKLTLMGVRGGGDAQPEQT
jgi:enoyl-CoA hydratase